MSGHGDERRRDTGTAGPISSVTAAQVHAAAIARYGEDNVGARELGETYESLLSMAARAETGTLPANRVDISATVINRRDFICGYLQKENFGRSYDSYSSH